jgi:hypothetical protein
MFRTVLPIAGLTNLLASVLVMQTTINMNSMLTLYLVMTEIMLRIALYFNFHFPATECIIVLKMASKLSVSYYYFISYGCSKEGLILFNLIAVKILLHGM